MTFDASNLDLIEPTDRRLNEVSTSVSPADIASDEIQAVIDRMLALAAGKGQSTRDTRQMVGLAAPQIGYPKRIIIIDLTADGSLKKQRIQAFLNPVLTRCSDETTPGREGCWSCGNICGNVIRAQAVALEALDRTGAPVRLELSDFTARIAQHETDHLDGIRFPDRIPEDEPEKLHWVTPDQFQTYRTEWAMWPQRCPRAKWLRMKKGIRP